MRSERLNCGVIILRGLTSSVLMSCRGDTDLSKPALFTEIYTRLSTLLSLVLWILRTHFSYASSLKLTCNCCILLSPADVSSGERSTFESRNGEALHTHQRGACTRAIQRTLNNKRGSYK